MDLLLHPKSQSAVDIFLANPSHGLLITGEVGAGKGTVAQHIVDKLLGLTNIGPGQLQQVGADGQTIPIESIREIIRFTKLTVPGTEVYRRAIIIENAGQLTNEAQNALLKLLEEPPANTILILTATSDNELLPTISSRLQRLAILPLSLHDSLNYFINQGFSKEVITRNYFVSNGAIGLLTALLGSDQSHPLAEQITIAKQILRASKFERLAMVDQLAKQKESLDTLLTALVRVSNAGLVQAMRTNNHAHITRLKQSVQAAVNACNMANKNPSMKLLLTQLMLEL